MFGGSDYCKKFSVTRTHAVIRAEWGLIPVDVHHVFLQSICPCNEVMDLCQSCESYRNKWSCTQRPVTETCSASLQTFQTINYGRHHSLPVLVSRPSNLPAAGREVLGGVRSEMSRHDGPCLEATGPLALLNVLQLPEGREHDPSRRRSVYSAADCLCVRFGAFT